MPKSKPRPPRKPPSSLDQMLATVAAPGPEQCIEAIRALSGLGVHIPLRLLLPRLLDRDRAVRREARRYLYRRWFNKR